MQLKLSLRTDITPELTPELAVAIMQALHATDNGKYKLQVTIEDDQDATL